MAKRSALEKKEMPSTALVQSRSISLADVAEAERPWERFKGEPEESYAIFLEMLNNVPQRSITGLFNHLEATHKGKYELSMLYGLADRYNWPERAYAYDRFVGTQILERNEKAMERIQTKFEQATESIIEKLDLLVKSDDPKMIEKVMGAMAAAGKGGLAQAATNMFKAIVGEKTEITVDGKFDHRVALAVVEFSKDKKEVE